MFDPWAEGGAGCLADDALAALQRQGSAEVKCGATTGDGDTPVTEAIWRSFCVLPPRVLHLVLHLVLRLVLHRAPRFSEDAAFPILKPITEMGER